jgi:aryl-alcohol dehydrogenase-like predicted oxidoreductase
MSSGSIPTRRIGTDEVSAIGFGAMGISAFYGSLDPDEERFKVLDAAFDIGCTFWDTSDVYGDSEVLLGNWFKRTGKRDKIFLATKFGIKADASGTRTVNGAPEYVREACERSLKRLGVDQIDLYYLHRVDQTRPIEQTIRAMAELVKEGKVKYLGISECSAETLRRAHAIHPMAAAQMEYSPFSLEIEEEKTNFLRTCRELGVQLVAYSPLGRGLLTGAYKSPDDFEEGDFRKHIPKFSAKNFPAILKLADGLKEVGQKYDASAGQTTLAWLLAQGQDVIPIPGTKKVKYLKENFEATKIRLSAEDVQTIRNLVDQSNDIEGDRYAAEFMTTTFAPKGRSERKVRAPWTYGAG